MQEPRTAAGLIMLAYLDQHNRGAHGRVDAELPWQFAAIESEARQALLVELREAVEGLPFRRMTGGGLDEGGTTGDLSWDWDEWEDVVARAAVLALLKDKEEGK